MNAQFNVSVARAFESNTVIPTFVYNGKVRENVHVHQILNTNQFVGKNPDGTYRTFTLAKVEVVG